MNILVCISHVPDTTTKVKFSGTKLNTDNIQWIINPWDELNLTRAIELKESGAGIDQIFVATVGDAAVEPTLRKGLAIGADKAFRVDVNPLDAYSTAMQIAEVIKKNPVDIVMTGFESADFNGSQVGVMLAEILDIPSFSAISGLDIKDNAVILTHEIDGGSEILKVTTPVVISVQKGIAINPRIPAMRGIMMSRTKPLEVIPSIAIDSKVNIESIELPSPKGKVKLFDAENLKDLVDALKNEAKVL